MSIMAHIGLTILLFLLLLRYLGRDIRGYDIRLLAVGSMLPDIVDKPLCWASLAPGRGCAHTLLFMVVILAASWRFGILELAFGNFMHLMLDTMFLDLKVLLWPMMGLSLEMTRHTVTYYWENILNSTYTQVTEALGLLCILYFVRMYRLYSISNLKPFLLKGRLDAMQN